VSRNPTIAGYWRLAAAGFLLAATGAVGIAALRVPSLELQQVVPETAWADLMAPWVLVVAMALFGMSCLRFARRREVLLALWLGVMAGLAALRELDLHVLVNPGNIHLLGLKPEHGVRFRLDWWTSGRTSGMARAAWAAVGLVLAGLVILPVAVARVPWLTRLRQRDTVVVLLAVAAAAMAAGYIIDDLIARALSSPAAAAMVEEGLEFTGEVLLAIASGVMAIGGRRTDGDRT
jgi:hypothetical protein